MGSIPPKRRDVIKKQDLTCCSSCRNDSSVFTVSTHCVFVCTCKYHEIYNRPKSPSRGRPRYFLLLMSSLSFHDECGNPSELISRFLSFFLFSLLLSGKFMRMAHRERVLTYLAWREKRDGRVTDDVKFGKLRVTTIPNGIERLLPHLPLPSPTVPSFHLMASIELDIFFLPFWIICLLFFYYGNNFWDIFFSSFLCSFGVMCRPQLIYIYIVS